MGGREPPPSLDRDDRVVLTPSCAEADVSSPASGDVPMPSRTHGFEAMTAVSPTCSCSINRVGLCVLRRWIIPGAVF